MKALPIVIVAVFAFGLGYFVGQVRLQRAVDDFVWQRAAKFDRDYECYSKPPAPQRLACRIIQP